MIKKLFNKESSTVCPKKRTTYFQTAVTSFRIVEIKKSGEMQKELEQTFPTHIITFLSLNWKPRYLSLKMTQCQKFFVKSIEK